MPLQVVDSNYLQHPERPLGLYLSASRSNKIAIPEEVLVEMHKRNAAVSVVRSLDQARGFPDQVVLLRGVTQFHSMGIRTAAKARSTIDTKQTPDFAAWYDLVRDDAEAADVQKHLSAMEAQSQAQLSEIGETVHDMLVIFEHLNSEFEPAELGALRGQQPYGPSTQRKLLDIMFRISRSLFRRSKVPETQWPKMIPDAPHYFLFRYSMCVTLLYTRWLQNGSWTQKRDRLVNDVMDMHIAAIGTYFSGVLSFDQRLNAVHREARFLLRNLGAYVG